MIQFFSENKLVIVGVFLGAIAGFLYWRLVGCTSGSCAITSKPFNSTLYGSVIGGLLFSFITTEKKKIKE